MDQWAVLLQKGGLCFVCSALTGSWILWVPRYCSVLEVDQANVASFISECQLILRSSQARLRGPTARSYRDMS